MADRLLKLHSTDYKFMCQNLGYHQGAEFIRYGVFCFIEDTNMALIGDTEKMEHKMKAKMTRKEAVACFEKHTPYAINASKIIDFYIEAGMLEIVEEKTKVKALLLKDCDGQFRLVDVLEIIGRLTDYGWKVTE